MLAGLFPGTPFPGRAKTYSSVLRSLPPAAQCCHVPVTVCDPNRGRAWLLPYLHFLHAECSPLLGLPVRCSGILYFHHFMGLAVVVAVVVSCTRTLAYRPHWV